MAQHMQMAGVRREGHRGHRLPSLSEFTEGRIIELVLHAPDRAKLETGDGVPDDEIVVARVGDEQFPVRTEGGSVDVAGRAQPNSPDPRHRTRRQRVAEEVRRWERGLGWVMSGRRRLTSTPIG